MLLAASIIDGDSRSKSVGEHKCSGGRTKGRGERREAEGEGGRGRIVDVMCCDVVADRRSHGVPAVRRGAEYCIIGPYPHFRVAGVVGSEGALVEKRLFA